MGDLKETKKNPNLKAAAMGDYNSPSPSGSDELIEEAAPMIRSFSCRLRRTFRNDTNDTRNIRKTWPNGASFVRWFNHERFMSRSQDPQAAVEKLWRKREKGLRRAQLQSNKAAPPNLAKD